MSLPFLLSTDLGARTLGLYYGSTEGLTKAVPLTLASPAAFLQAVQTIGNLGQQLGQGKELWMAPLHPFLLQSISRVRDFLDQLVDMEGDDGEFPWPCRYLARHSPGPLGPALPPPLPLR